MFYYIKYWVSGRDIESKGSGRAVEGREGWDQYWWGTGGLGKHWRAGKAVWWGAGGWDGGGGWVLGDLEGREVIIHDYIRYY